MYCVLYQISDLKYQLTITTFYMAYCLMRTKQKMHPNFSIAVMEVNKLSTHLGAHPTIHVNEVNNFDHGKQNKTKKVEHQDVIYKRQ
jgi:hypothetical protein